MSVVRVVEECVSIVNGVRDEWDPSKDPCVASRAGHEALGEAIERLRAYARGAMVPGKPIPEEAFGASELRLHAIETPSGFRSTPPETMTADEDALRREIEVLHLRLAEANAQLACADVRERRLQGLLTDIAREARRVVRWVDEAP